MLYSLQTEELHDHGSSVLYLGLMKQLERKFSKSKAKTPKMYHTERTCIVFGKFKLIKYAITFTLECFSSKTPLFPSLCT